MCIYTVKKQKLKKKTQGGNSTESLKLGVSGQRDTAKTKKD